MSDDRALHCRNCGDSFTALERPCPRPSPGRVSTGEYRELEASDAELYRRCVERASTVVMNNHRALEGATVAERSRLAADIEAAMVSIAMEARRDR